MAQRRSTLLRWRAACPYCGSRFPRSEYFHSGPRRCGGCDATLKPAEPANMLGNLAFGVPLGLAVFALITYLGVAGAPTIRAKVTIAVVVVVLLAIYFGFAAWVWPFITPFAATLWRCWNCRVELVHRFPLCPRCGAPSRMAPTVRAGKVIPSGSDGSPATLDSA